MAVMVSDYNWDASGTSDWYWDPAGVSDYNWGASGVSGWYFDESDAIQFLPSDASDFVTSNGFRIYLLS